MTQNQATPQAIPRPWRRWIFVVALIAALLISPELVSRCFFSTTLKNKFSSSSKFEKIELIGKAASHTVLDGQGEWFNQGKLTEILIRSKKRASPSQSPWDRPSDIIIRNGRLRGSIRIMGMGRNGEAKAVRQSSHQTGHTQRAQAAAPTRILISHVDIEADHRIPIYIAPGVTHVTIENCHISGLSSSVALYLDAESAHITIRNNTFDIRPSREIIAIDGSAHNTLSANRFDHIPFGAIYLYRNCGEGGTVRHQPPHHNIISNNHFATRTLGWWSYGVWIGSRQGRRPYRHADDGYPFGSSLDNHDFANHNTLRNNTFTPAHTRAIRDQGENNQISP
ncbi:MAG: right-handed parallel beta-helix repeat-containing protein [Verrucomicrobiota bacterium]